MEYTHDQVAQMEHEESLMDAHIKKCYEAGILSDTEVKITIEVNGQVEVIKQNFIHNADEQKRTLWADSVALELGEKVEEVIKEKNLLF